MPYLWIEQTPGEWAVRPLTSPLVSLAASAPPDNAGTVLVHCDSPSCKGWHLLAPLHEQIWLNGLPLVAGMRALVDRDEIRTASGDTYFFSAEELAQIESLPGADTPIMCPRCRQSIDVGTEAVRCPQCRLWHHQSAALPCWTYAPTCAMCPQPSALDAGFQWTPMAL